MGKTSDVESILERVRLMDWMSLGSVGGYIWVLLASLLAGDPLLNLWFIAGCFSFLMVAGGRVCGAAVRKEVREQEGTSPDDTIERTASIGSGIDLAAVTGLSFSAAGVGGGAGTWTVLIGVLLAGTGFLLARATGEKIHHLRSVGDGRLGRFAAEQVIDSDKEEVLKADRGTPKKTNPDGYDDRAESGLGRGRRAGTSD